VRASSSGRHIRRKAVGRSRNRGCKGHRILRRVLDGGRHLRLSRAISFHEKVVTATLAASSRGKAIRLARAKATKETRRRSGSRARGRGDRGVRGSIGSRHRGKKTPTLGTPASERPARGFEARQCVSAAIRRSVHECRENTRYPGQPHGAQDSVRRPHDESRVANRERTRYGCT